MLISNVLHLCNMKSLTLEEVILFANKCGYKYAAWEEKILKIEESGNYSETNFVLKDGLIHTEHKDTVLVDIIDLSVIGAKIRKRSDKPFKSGDKMGIVTGFKINEEDPKRGISYEVDGDSLVNISRCKLYFE